MHDLNDETNTIDRQVVESPELLGKECRACLRILAYKYFNRDTSKSDGHVDQCNGCAAAPRLSLLEHTARLRELNRASHAVKKQRRENQDDYKNDAARVGRQMQCSEFLRRVQKLVPSIYVTEGRIAGDLALYQTYPGPQAALDGNDFKYLFYVPDGLMNEFSQYEFEQDKDIMIKESKRGWRTPLLRLILNGLITEEQARVEFGEAVGEASTVWHRTLWKHRNKAAAA